MALTDKGDNTGNVFIDALAAYSFLDIGGDRNITYYFATSGNNNPHNWQYEKVPWQTALQQWVNVANITAQEVFSPDAADLGRRGSVPIMTAAHGLGPDGLPYQAIMIFRRAAAAPPTGSTTGSSSLRSFRQRELLPAASVTGPSFMTIGQGLGLDASVRDGSARERTLVPRRHERGRSGRLRL